MPHFSERTHSHTKINRMDALFEAIKDSRDPLLQSVADDIYVRKAMNAGRDTSHNAVSSKPRRQKYSVDTTLSSLNAARSSGVMECNADMPDFIKGSASNLFNGNSQTERCAGPENRGNYQRVKGF